jgi:hypothetical protein
VLPTYLPTAKRMDHRYGRHGPDAWLKWRARHYVPPTTPPPVPTTRTTVYVYNLSQTERIIYIVTGEPQRYEENGETGHPTPFTQVPFQVQSGDTVIELPPGDSNLRDAVRWQASDDAEEVTSILREKPIVQINVLRVEERIKKIIRSHLEKTRGSGGPPSVQERERLLSVAIDAYWGEFYKWVSEDRTKLIITLQEIKLRDLAIRDRKTYPTYTSRRFHQRDLAVIRTLSVLDLHVDNDNDALLETIHDFADKYEGYFRNQEEEVEWPSNGFRT